jgi:hypothetical protein
MQRIGTSDGLFVNGNPAAGVLGTVCTAEWLNSVQEELASILVAAGAVLNPGSHVQVRDSIISLIEDRVTSLASAAETIAGTRNDLAVTPAGLGALTATTSRAGLSRFATAAEVQDGNSDTLGVTVAGLLGLFSKTNFSSSPYLRIPDRPGGFIIQWGIAASVGTDATSPYIAFPVTFPNAVFVILPGHILSASSSGPSAPCSVKSDYTTSNFRLIQDTEGPSSGEFWIAIGN